MLHFYFLIDILYKTKYLIYMFIILGGMSFYVRRYQTVVSTFK